MTPVPKEAFHVFFQPGFVYAKMEVCEYVIRSENKKEMNSFFSDSSEQRLVITNSWDI